MLNLSDADLAKLRLDAMIFTMRRNFSKEQMEAEAGQLVEWCLRDRELQE